MTVPKTVTEPCVEGTEALIVSVASVSDASRSEIRLAMSMVIAPPSSVAEAVPFCASGVSLTPATATVTVAVVVTPALSVTRTEKVSDTVPLAPFTAAVLATKL